MARRSQFLVFIIIRRECAAYVKLMAAVRGGPAIAVEVETAPTQSVLLTAFQVLTTDYIIDRLM